MCTNNLRVEHFFPTIRDDGLLLPAVDLLLPAVQDEGLLLPAVQDRSLESQVPADQSALPDPYAFQLIV
jgi:hypothetical protein